MTEAAKFFSDQRIEASRREHWKDVDRYKIFYPPITKGDASIVYMAEGEGRVVAVKAYPKEWMQDNEGILENELSGFTTLAAAGLVPILLRKPLTTTNNIYLVMELCNCGSLDLMIHKGLHFPLGVIKDVASFLAAAMLQMHTTGLLHREINPRHVLVNLSPAGEVSYKLIGLQFFKDVSTARPSSFVGTPEYICPEAAQELEYSFPADVWSFGVTLYELAVGATSLKIDPDFRFHVKSGEPPIFPEDKSRPVSLALRDLICKCLAYDPAKRPTADQILESEFLTSNPPVVPVIVGKIEEVHKSEEGKLGISGNLTVA